jgi:hypothetical protein
VRVRLARALLKEARQLAAGQTGLDVERNELERIDTKLKLISILVGDFANMPKEST